MREILWKIDLAIILKYASGFISFQRCSERQEYSSILGMALNCIDILKRFIKDENDAVRKTECEFLISLMVGECEHIDMLLESYEKQYTGG